MSRSDSNSPDDYATSSVKWSHRGAPGSVQRCNGWAYRASPVRRSTRGRSAGTSERYGSLSIEDDDASFDIFTQIAAAVGLSAPASPARRRGRRQHAVDPMGGLRVERLLAAGESQSACRLATYYNAIQPVTQRFDGFLIIIYAGCGTRVEAAGPGPGLDAIPEELRSVINILPFGSHLLRVDLAAPVLILNSETEVLWYRLVRQPDTSTHRLWRSPARRISTVDSGRKSKRNGAGLRRGALAADHRERPDSPNSLSFDPAMNAALRHIWSWIRDGGPSAGAGPRWKCRGAAGGDSA